MDWDMFYYQVHQSEEIERKDRYNDSNNERNVHLVCNVM